ncbi:hypothetical protein H2198_003031 [Neophaeococcomyces mojaviensis]|uniref:Uncharacterized protein n=1 Tax=Neophaeococcomyces mojaviensis TaxID=3383035 RepID=A0ACC3AD02_9EURO|nr:hypothetical protein H2198_003031 [Knufia sp. JES_112]
MSSFDQDVAELRSIESDNEDIGTAAASQQDSAATAFAPPKSSSQQLTESELERQPLLNQTSPSPTPSAPSQSTPALPTHTNANTTADSESESQESKGWSADMPSSLFFVLSTIYGASSVALGAFGAHGLKKRIADPGRIANWNTAAQYQVCFHLTLSISTNS